MTKEAIERRIAELREMLKQIEANGNATIGAINECERWLKIIDQQKAANDDGASRDTN